MGAEKFIQNDARLDVKGPDLPALQRDVQTLIGDDCLAGREAGFGIKAFAPDGFTIRQ